MLALSLAGCGTRKPKVVEQPAEQIPVPTPAPVEEAPTHWTRPTGDSIREEMRAVWLTTVYGLDWPRDKADTPAACAARRSRSCVSLTACKLMATTRSSSSSATAVRSSYPSDYEPLSTRFAGEGFFGDYDPVRFAIELATHVA